MSTYLDCNATTPIEPEVIEVMRFYLEEEFGNSGSRTHDFGTRAQQGVEAARGQVASVVNASKDEVIFTSGATESNNLALLGLAEFGKKENKRHIISTAIEHKAILDPLSHLESQGFTVTYIYPDRSGMISPQQIVEALREDTLLVSVMAANNETGGILPIKEIAIALSDHSAYFHTDAAQLYGKELTGLRNKRIDLISISGHKIYGPKGVGALICRKRGYKRPPLNPIFFGGGQEKGLRPGTLPVHLIAGLGKAAELAVRDNHKRAQACLDIREQALEALAELNPVLHSTGNTLPHVINLSIPGINSEAAIIALKGVAAISNGSACTSHSYTLSHVLQAMQLPEDEIRGALRVSWCHMTPTTDWKGIVKALKDLL